jgi:tetratricopeptide (TPR) repeat protein
VLSAAPGANREIAFRRAELLARLGELATAEKLYLGLLAASRGTDLAAWEGAAATMSAARRDAEFLRMTESMVARATEQTPLDLRRKLHGLRGMAQEALGQMDEALASYERVIALGDPDPVTLNNAAWILARHKRQSFDQAWVYASRALELMPDSPSIQHTAAMVLAASGKTEEALARLEQAIAAQARQAVDARGAVKPDYLCDRAELLVALSRREEALKQVDEVLRLYAGTSAAARAAVIRAQIQAG